MSEKENSQDITECDKSNTIVNETDSNTIVSNLEAQVTTSSQVSNLEEFTLGSWNFPVGNLEEGDTPVTIGGWNYPMGDLEESDWDTPFYWGGIRATLLYEIERFNEMKKSDHEVESKPIKRGYSDWQIKRIETEYKLEKEQIIEIVRNLANNKSHIVYGYWFCCQWKCGHKKPLQCMSREKCEYRDKLDNLQLLYSGKCKHKSQCQSVMECRDKFKRKWQTENNCKVEWRIRYDQGSFKKYLKEILERPLGWLDFFQTCVNKHENLISSFLLYTSENSNKPDVEIIRHLVWKRYYRVFGNWRCSHCQKKWKSAYTWISLQKFIKKTPGKHCMKGDYVMQKCKEIRCGNDGFISSYEHLVRSESAGHKRDLCAKCQSGYDCFDSSTYFGYQYI